MELFQQLSPWVLPTLMALCFLTSLVIYGKHYQIFNWPSVEGIITKSEFCKEFNPLLNGREFLVFVTEIEYEYEVDGESHVGYQVSSTQLDSNVDLKAAMIAKKYPLGYKGKVYYQKDDPEHAIFENLFPSSLYFFIFWFITFAVFQEIMFPDFYIFSQY